MIKNLFILWFQGFENAPEVVNRCVESWKYYNADWKIILLTEKNLKEYIPESHYVFKKKDMEYYEKSDVIRLELLKRYGGLWADSTLFCNRPLNEWLESHIKEGFFAFSKPSEDKSMSNWFLYSESDNYVLDKIKEKMDNYYVSNNKSWNYFMMHYYFDEIKNKDCKFNDIWNRIKHIKSSGPHLLHKKGYFSLENDIKEVINSKTDPVYKLSHKIEFLNNDVRMAIYYLYTTINKKLVSEICPAIYPCDKGYMIGVIIDK